MDQNSSNPDNYGEENFGGDETKSMYDFQDSEMVQYDQSEMDHNEEDDNILSMHGSMLDIKEDPPVLDPSADNKDSESILEKESSSNSTETQ